MNRIKAFWNSLPHQVQVTIIGIATAASSAAVSEVKEWITVPNPCFTLACIQAHWHTAIHAAVIAAVVFYMNPNRNGAPVVTEKKENQ